MSAGHQNARAVLTGGREAVRGHMSMHTCAAGSEPWASGEVDLIPRLLPHQSRPRQSIMVMVFWS